MRFCAISAFVHPNHLLELAPVAEEHGWDTLAISDHVLHPETIESRYPYGDDGSRMWDETTPWPDVWVATGMMAAVTTRLRFFQSVYVLPMRDPFHVAKAIGTVAVMSNYRISLGLGLGWMKDEFELLGRPFEQRGARTDEMIEVMRKLWTGEYVEHHGRFYDFPRLSMSPGMTEDIPVIVGGISDAALRRVARLGDGWAPAYLTIDQVAEKIAKIRSYQDEYGRSGHPLSIFTSCVDATDLDGFRRMQDIGVTDLMAVPWALYDDGLGWLDPTGSPLPKMLDSLKRFADDIIAKL
jgi:probable F420-dependent oxidoreductase